MNAKKLKRFLSVVLSLSMVLSLNTVSFAAEAGEAGAAVSVHTEAEAQEAPGNTQEEEGSVPQEEAGNAQEAEAMEEAPGTAPEAEAPQAAHEHDWVYVNDLRPATCLKAGVAIYQCQNDGCDAIKGQKYETIPKKGHQFDPEAEDYEEGKGYQVEAITAATCQTEGSEKRICQRPKADGTPCGEFVTADLPKTDHQWDESSPKTAEANCLEAAKTYIGCEHCDAVKPGSEEYDPERPALKHGYDRTGAAENTDYLKQVVPPGCITDGYTEYTCKDANCPAEDKGKVKRETVPALGHGYERADREEGVDFSKETTEATCTADGGETYTCLDCAEETEGHTWIPEDKKVKALGHGYDRKGAQVNVDYKKRLQPATCIAGGYTEYTCEDANCPNASTDKAAVQRNKVNALGHGYEREGKVLNTDYTADTVEATCTNDGYTTYTCKHCSSETDGHSITPEDEKVKGGHKWGAQKVEVAEANCKDPAQYDYVCSVCEGEKGEREPHGVANANSHVFDQENEEFSSVFKPATCKINGLTRLTCTFCKNATTFEVVKAAHDYIVQENIAPTCTEDGTLTKVCQRGDACDDPDTKTVTEHPAMTGHKYKSEVTTPATCKEKGTLTKTCQNTLCDSVVTEDVDVDPTNHTNWSEEGTHQATCTTPEITGKYCMDCGALHEGAEKTKEALGHRFAREGMTDEKFEEYVNTLPNAEDKEYVKVTKDASCTEAGTKLYTCPDCEEENNTKEVTIPKTSHTWDTENAYIPPTCTENAKHVLICKVCTAKGETTDLGSISDEYKATGHKYTEAVEIFREETCSRNGVAQYKCKTCELTQNKVIPAAHKYEVVAAETTAATCTAAGKEVKECTRQVCDNPESKKVETVVEALGHDFDAGTVTKTANCADKGELTKACQRDGCTEEDVTEIPTDANNHKNMQTVSNRDATCTVPKIVSGSYCDACGACSEDAVTEGEALGHRFARMTDEAFEAYVKTLSEPEKYVKVTKEATCTEAGTKVYTCPDCQVANNTKDVPIKAVGHEFKDKYTAPTCTENGKVQKVCSRKGCGTVGGPVEDLGEMDKKLGHNIVVTKGKPATCQATGLTDGKACSRQGCGYIEVAQKVIGIDTVNGHNWAGEGLGDDDYREATCTKPGVVVHYCTVEGCGESKPEVLEAGHLWEEKFADGDEAFAEADTVLYRVCERAGAADCNAKPYEVLLVMPGAGYCEECEKYVWKETVEGTPATCTEEGLSDGEVCGNGCGFVFLEQETIDALGHKDTTWEVEIAPTCKKAGKEKEICGVCEKETGRIRDVAATGEHQYVYKLTDATCTTNDTLNSVCKNCGDLNPNNVPEELPGTALGHDFGEDDVCTRCHKGKAYASTAVTAYKDGTANKIRFTATAGVADEERYQLLDRGILYITSKDYCEDPESTGAELKRENVGKYGVRCTTFPAGRTEDTYYIAINVTGNEGRKLWARAYTLVMDLETGEQVVFYGEILNESYNSVTGTAK